VCVHQDLSVNFPLSFTVKEPLCDPLVPARWRVPLNLRLPTAPLALPLPPVALVTPWKVTVIGPLSPFEHPCVALDWVTVKVILLDPLAMLPLPPNGSHCAVAAAVPLPLSRLEPKTEFVPEPVIEEMVTLLFTMSIEALPENLAVKLTVFAL